MATKREFDEFRWVLLASVALAMIAGCEHRESKPPTTAAGAPSGVRGGEPIRLGATLPLTGDIASYGQKAMRGIKLALGQRNERGGLLGRRIDVKFLDDRGKAMEGVGNVTRLAAIDNVPVIFGAAGSSVALAVAPVASRHKVILLSPISSSAKLSTEGGDYFFRTCPADELQAIVLADWVHECGAKRVAVIYTNNIYGQPLANGFVTEFTKRGGSVLLSDGSAEGTSDFRTIVAKLIALPNLDAVVSPTYPKEGATFVRQSRELGFEKPLFGADDWSAPEFRNVAGDAGNGVRYLVPTVHANAQSQQFTKDYTANFGEEPDIFAAYAYDAAHAAFNAIEACGCTDGPGIRDALLKVSFPGASGDIAFRPNGDIAAQDFARITVEDGHPKRVSAAGG